MKKNGHLISAQCRNLCLFSASPSSVTDVDGSIFFNPAMKSLLGFVGDDDSLDIEPSHVINVFKEQERLCFERQSFLSMVNTLPFGRDKEVQSWMFDFYPLPDDDGKKIIGTLCHARPFLSCSLSEFVKGETPSPLTFKCPDDNFTLREWEIIFFITNGLTSKEVGRKLGISYRTVNNRLKVIYNKVGASSKKELSVFVNDSSDKKYIPKKFISPSSFELTGF